MLHGGDDDGGRPARVDERIHRAAPAEGGRVGRYDRDGNCRCRHDPLLAFCIVAGEGFRDLPAIRVHGRLKIAPKRCWDPN